MLFLYTVLILLLNSLWQPIDQVQDFTLTNAVDGSSFSLSNYKNSPAVVVIFTSNDCPYDKLYHKRISSLIDSYRPQGVKFVLINSNDPGRSPSDSPPQMAQKVREMRWNVPYLVDSQQRVASLFGAQKTPEAFLLQHRDGGFKVLYSGSIDDNPQVASDVSNSYLKMAIDAALQGQPVLVNDTHPTGCMIK